MPAQLCCAYLLHFDRVGGLSPPSLTTVRAIYGIRRFPNSSRDLFFTPRAFRPRFGFLALSRVSRLCPFLGSCSLCGCSTVRFLCAPSSQPVSPVQFLPPRLKHLPLPLLLQPGIRTQCLRRQTHTRSSLFSLEVPSPPYVFAPVPHVCELQAVLLFGFGPSPPRARVLCPLLTPCLGWLAPPPQGLTEYVYATFISRRLHLPYGFS